MCFEWYIGDVWLLGRPIAVVVRSANPDDLAAVVITMKESTREADLLVGTDEIHITAIHSTSCE